MLNVLILGGTTYDSIISLPQLPQPVPQTIHYAPFHETIGSTGAGKAINLSRLNVPCVLHSIIGDDPYGHRITKTLQQAGVNFQYDIDPKGTERHVNLMDQEGNRISIFVTQSSEHPPLDLIKLEELISQCDLVVLNIISYTKELIGLCQKYRKPIWTDLHDYNGTERYHDDFIEAADYIFMSSDRLEDYRSVMETLHHKGTKLIVCTHGKKGATSLTEDGVWSNSSIIADYPYKDANGAGDSFFSGFLYGYLHNKSLEECMGLATICAGLCITSEELAYPSLSEEVVTQEYEKYYEKSI
ncbi:carbohydrate kinase family protein [Paenibacillus anaericanus]|uniref:Carbohydrate kinase family protein n=1 Tax=Paenibacillus anaericanus TaxID=170367 RepID=A0A433YEF4_9BACL|nr:carbohydrate kinase family protein [Paenibacillus anaericanus]RUT48247.1 carbohydrate kinase family protein [Paenibacillus anaericanus]